MLFGGPVIREIATTGRSEAFERTVCEIFDAPMQALGMGYGELYDRLYDHLCKHYRSEYIYRNSVASLLQREGRLARGTAMLSELRVGKAKADLVVIGQTSSVYEIKTELDNLDRLDRQLSEYLRMFDRVNVLTCERLASRVAKAVTEDVGVTVLTEKGEMLVLRPALSNIHRVDPAVIFDSLRQSEYVGIIGEVFGEVPTVPNTRLFRECKSRFVTLDPQVAHGLMVGAFRQRTPHPKVLGLIERMPRSLISAVLTSSLPARAIARLEAALLSSPA